MVENYIWQSAKNKDGQFTEKKMIDMTKEELQKAYDHTKSMLYSRNTKHLGRAVLLDNIHKQMKFCNTELALRWFTSLRDDKDELRYTNVSLLNELRNWIATLPLEQQSSDLFLGQFVQVPVEFKDVKIQNLMKACSDTLGGMDHSSITFSFLYSLGIWLTGEENRELDSKLGDRRGNYEERFGLIKFWHNIPDNITLHYNPKGLNYHQFVDIYHLKIYNGFLETKYSDMTTSLLQTLRNKVLPILEHKVMWQYNKWKNILFQIEEVAKLNQFELS